MHTATGTRARVPDESGHATAEDGLRLYCELHGRGLVYDGRGNGKAESPDPAQQWLYKWWASDCLTVLDATATETAVLNRAVR
jgi:hypothetical protein